jgi:putative membrane protein
MRKGIIWLVVCLFALGFALGAQAADKAAGGKDQKFVTEAASGGMMEVQLGQMASDKAQAQEVKDFGARMVKDHSKANDELKSLAQQKKLNLPTELEAKHRKVVDKLQKASGADFDKQYMREMVKDHTKDVAEFRKAGQEVQDPDLKGWVTKTQPVLEEHLQLARTTAQTLGVDVKKAEEEGRQAAEKGK